MASQEQVITWHSKAVTRWVTFHSDLLRQHFDEALQVLTYHPGCLLMTFTIPQCVPQSLQECCARYITIFLFSGLFGVLVASHCYVTWLVSVLCLGSTVDAVSLGSR